MESIEQQTRSEREEENDAIGAYRIFDGDANKFNLFARGFLEQVVRYKPLLPTIVGKQLRTSQEKQTPVQQPQIDLEQRMHRQ